MSMDETPTYHRRRTEEIPADQLTNHRLQNLEEGVRQMTTAIAASHAVLGEISTRLAVGKERFDVYDRRVESLEKDRRWVVLSVLAAFGSLVWQAIRSLMGNHAPILVAALLLSGCGEQRAQVGADARAGVQAARAAMAHDGIEQADVILVGVDKRLPAATGVNSQDWPKPAMTIEQIRANPAQYSDTAPPEPSHLGWIAGLSAAGLALLAISRQVAPFIPGIGPAWKGAADAIYAVVQHAQAKQADEAAEVAKKILDEARPALALMRAATPLVFSKLPVSAQVAIAQIIESEKST